ncbi:phytanoyl-CoA dioxygenase family protein [Luminiphilus sp.]|nr:phytanoyl-CoA dioxygenase family protein [Luminiphilus sp.]
MDISYVVDGEIVCVVADSDQEFLRGEDEVLAHRFHDVTMNSDWRNEGFEIISLGENSGFLELALSVEKMVKEAIEKVFPEKDLTGFSLEQYHNYVTINEHADSLDKQIKRFFWQDLQFDDAPIIHAIEEEVGVKLGYSPKGSEEPHWIIVRVNMPGSTSYNPVHKDVYEEFDAVGVCPEMINAWIPICGVNHRAGLSIAPGSHLIPESQILRTKAGSIMNGNKYFVNCIKSWGDDTGLQTVFPAEGEMLVFSSHLIHGLGRNMNSDTTRVALEFRLHTVGC